MDVNFELYKVFYFVTVAGSFSGAAQKLFISQSAVSQSIRALEQKLKVTLFVRTPRHISLTPAGQALYEHVRPAYALLRSGEQRLLDLHSLSSGEIRIAASDTICKYHLLPFLHDFHRQYPHVLLSIINRTSPRCLDLLQEGAADIAFINLPESTPANLDIFPLFTIHDCFVANDAFVNLKEQTLQLDALAEYPLLVLERNTVTRAAFDQLCHQHQLALTPTVELGSLDLLAQMAAIGLGISFVIQEYVKELLEAGTLFRLQTQEPIPPRQVGAATHRRIPLAPAPQQFLELITAMAVSK